ncbi:MAG TPA: glycerol-3-phosphate acyltransferase [Eubacteriales bacterium]|nr:glycerol-3-phosphate acyltransferase [Eubacteriales bacterium]
MTFFNGFFTVNFWTVLACVIAGYLLGNIQTAIIVSKRYFHDDVRNHGSGNAGSTNMVRVYGYGPGAITFAGDFAKAALGIVAGQLLCGTVGGYIAGLCVVIGHCWPVFDGFRGGKGVASSAGIAMLTFPLGAGIAIALGALLLAVNKRVSLMSMTSILLFFICVLIFRLHDLPLVALSALLVIVIYVRHIDNIKRLLHGEEQRLKKEGR